MSQYRDALEAAQRRAETLEAKLRERDATLAVKEAEGAERDAEIARLRRIAGDGAGPRRDDTPGARHTSLLGLVLAGSSFAMAAGYIGVMHRATHPCLLEESAFLAPGPATPAPTGATATPPPAVTAGVPTVAAVPETLRDPFARLAAATDEDALKRVLGPKVMSGRASLDEMRMLKALCSHGGDRTCRDQVSALIKRRLETTDDPGH